MDINILVKVTSRAWALNILALMHRGIPGRQAALLLASGAGRTGFAQSLGHLVDLGLMEKNPGHGHPLRPEYRLTPKGTEIAATADSIEKTLLAPPERELVQRSWTVPVLAVSQAPRHFSQIKNDLEIISDRALSLSIKQLQAKHWLSREVDVNVYPPRPLYKAINAGAQISQAVGVGAL